MVEDRIRVALREIVASGQGWDRPAPRRWPAVAMAGLAVAAIVAVVALLPVWTGGNPRSVAAGGQPTLPQAFPGYALGQGMMDGPFGRAIAMYHNGTGHEDWSFSQVIVAGADENRYRQLNLSEVELGIGVGARLFPDGTRVVTGGRGVITVIDLLTGGRKDYPAVNPALSTTPRAVSADGRRVAFVHFLQYDGDGSLYILDLETGEISPPLDAEIQQLAFGPDGELAVQKGQRVRVMEWPNKVRLEFDLPTSTELAGPQSWTPDGKFLVTVHTGPTRYEGDLMYAGPRSFVFVDVTGQPARQSIPADDLLPRAWGDSVLGWRSPTTMLVSGGDVNGTTSNLIQEVDITSGDHRVISRFRVGRDDDLAVGDVQLATGLVPLMGLRSGANPDRGVWPTWLIITVIVCFVPVTLTILLTRRRRPQRGGG